ncbi:MAG: SoxR reducing system RseC family protein [Bacteroidales bacterium]|nr:SoxR reducing system RseC family protein [Bacteroidales bacterium]
MKQQIRYKKDGIIKNISDTKVEVLVCSTSACSGCQASGVCGMTDENQKLVTVYLANSELKIGDAVAVLLDVNNANYALFYSYILPLLIVLIVLFTSSYWFSELVAGIVSIVILLPYYLTLYFMNKKFLKKISYQIEKISD